MSLKELGELNNGHLIVFLWKESTVQSTQLLSLRWGAVCVECHRERSERSEGPFTVKLL